MAAIAAARKLRRFSGSPRSSFIRMDPSLATPRTINTATAKSRIPAAPSVSRSHPLIDFPCNPVALTGTTASPSPLLPSIATRRPYNPPVTAMHWRSKVFPHPEPAARSRKEPAMTAHYAKPAKRTALIECRLHQSARLLARAWHRRWWLHHHRYRVLPRPAFEKDIRAADVGHSRPRNATADGYGGSDFHRHNFRNQSPACNPSPAEIVARTTANIRPINVIGSCRVAQNIVLA